LMFARVGEPRCPTHNVTLAAQTISQMVDQVLALPEGEKLMIVAPIIQERKGEHTKVLENLAAQGFIRARIDGELCDLSDPPKLDHQDAHSTDVAGDRFLACEGFGLRAKAPFKPALPVKGETALAVPMDGHSSG